LVFGLQKHQISLNNLDFIYVTKLSSFRHLFHIWLHYDCQSVTPVTAG